MIFIYCEKWRGFEWILNYIMTNKKLVICIPTGGLVDWQFASSLMALQLLPETRVIWMVKTMIDSARNMLVQEALKDSSYTHMLMIDDVMTFEPDFVLNLLEHDVDIVGGLAFKRRAEYTPCVFEKRKDAKYYPILPEVFREVDVVGTGGILINMDIFKNVKYPWFETYYDDDNVHWSVDFDFCIKAKKAGYKIFIDPKSEMGHIGDPIVIKKEQFFNYIKQNDINKNNNK